MAYVGSTGAQTWATYILGHPSQALPSNHSSTQQVIKSPSSQRSGQNHVSHIPFLCTAPGKWNAGSLHPVSRWTEAKASAQPRCSATGFGKHHETAPVSPAQNAAHQLRCNKTANAAFRGANEQVVRTHHFCQWIHGCRLSSSRLTSNTSILLNNQKKHVHTPRLLAETETCCSQFPITFSTLYEIWHQQNGDSLLQKTPSSMNCKSSHFQTAKANFCPSSHLNWISTCTTPYLNKGKSSPNVLMILSDIS